MWRVFAIDPILAYLLAVVLGLVAGSAITVVGYRLPRIMERDWVLSHPAWQRDVVPGEEPSDTLWRPGWHCATCHALVRGWRRLPVLSWMMARGRCGQCHAPIGWRYPLTEALMAGLFVLCVWRFGTTPVAICAMGLCAALVLLSWVDLQSCLLPDAITLPLAWAGLLVNLDGALVPLPLAVLGAVGGYGFLWLLFHLFHLITGREGMGYGDFKLLAALGAWLGLASLPVLLLVASSTGVLGALALRITGRAQAGQALPFGPYLALGGVVVLFALPGL